MRCLAGCVFSSVIGGKILTGGDLEERISLASLTFICVVSEVLAAVFFFVGGRSCHQGSERLSSLSDFPCQLSIFSSFRLRGFSDFTSSRMNPPLYCLRFCFQFIFGCLWINLTKFVEFSKDTSECCLKVMFRVRAE